MSIDPGLGLVVMEFRNDAGKVTSTIPTQKQLDSYRTARLEDHKSGATIGPKSQARASDGGSQGAGSLAATAQFEVPSPPVPSKTSSTETLASSAGTAPSLVASSPPPKLALS